MAERAKRSFDVTDAEVEAAYDVLGDTLSYGLTTDAFSVAEMKAGPREARDLIRQALRAAKAAEGRRV